MTIPHKIKILTNIFLGFSLKYKYKIFYNSSSKDKTKNKNNIIVSLTSYGRRVSSNVVYYTILSLLNQSIKPDKIILWLDNSWNIHNLPKKLKKLITRGLEIRFCEDLKSYKKLIPTLEEYPQATIITVDDDIIYKKNTIKKLIETSKKYPDKIVCNNARFPIPRGWKFETYNNWPENSHSNKDFVMPIGEGGILYPPHTFDREIFNKEIFMSLCPFADDIWFWIMAKRNNKNHIVINPDKKSGYSFDALYQFFHKGSALTHSNSKKNQNDTQLESVMDYYKLVNEDLKNYFKK